MGLGNLNLGCECCDVCENCSGATPTSFQVVVEGISDNPCSGCESSWEGTYVVPQNVDINQGSLVCLWLLYVGDRPSFDACTQHNASIRVSYELLGGVYILEVEFWERDEPFAFVLQHRFRYEFGTDKPDCLPIDGIVVPYLDTFGLQPGCDFSGATITVTAIE